jgi:hypothetical protein
VDLRGIGMSMLIKGETDLPKYSQLSICHAPKGVGTGL